MPFSLSLSLALFLAPAIAQAQAIPRVVVGADGRYEHRIDPKTRVDGVSPAVMVEFRRQFGAMVDYVDSLPAVNTPPAPICHRLSTYIEVAARFGVPGASLSVMTPINFTNGKCHNMTGGGFELYVNKHDTLISSQRASWRGAEQGTTDWFVLDRKGFTPGRIQLAPATFALFRADRPLMRPVSRERVLRQQIGEEPPAITGDRLVDGLRADHQRRQAMLAAMSPADRAAPACMARDGPWIDLQGCATGLQVWEFVPDYYDRKRAGDFQVIVLSSPTNRYHGESEQIYASRRAMLGQLDLNRLAGMIR